VKRKVVVAVLVGIAGLACSACGSFLLNGAPSRSGPVAVVHQLPLTQIGSGSESLGTFAVHGIVHFRATCAGTGKIKVNLSGPREGFGIGPVACRGNNRLAINITSNSASGPTEITVDAPADVTWWLDVVDRQPKL